MILQKTYETGPIWDRRLVTIQQKSKSAILMSGGLDSWVLYNLLDPSIKIFTYLRTDGVDNIDRVKKLTRRDDVIGIPNKETNKFDLDYCEDWIFDNFDIEEIFIATNIIPHLAYFPEFQSKGVPNRAWYNDDHRMNTPFSHLYKYHIVDLAQRNNVDLSATNSCLYMPDRNCGECWQCKERQWGFDQLKLGVINE